MTDRSDDSSNAITIPPFIYLACLAVGFAVDYVFPVPVFPDTLQYVVGGILIAASALLVQASFRSFRKAGTSVDSRLPTTAIVKTGPFRFSRNPGYVAMNMLYLGIGIAADSIWVLSLLPVAFAVLHYGVVLREEAYLERKFGDEYRAYKAAVRRWL
jgi:protein-S-isoprenylcysteine O-methyltransferase Ste14